MDLSMPKVGAIASIFAIALLLYAANFDMEPLKRRFNANYTPNDVKASPTNAGADVSGSITRQYYLDEEGKEVVREAGAGSCRSRFEAENLWSNKTAMSRQAPSRAFVEALRRYEKYHRDCTRQGGFALNETAWAGEAPPGCKYMVWESMDGMGNQLISLVSAFVYSLLTNRVLLIATDNPHVTLHNLFCEPFPYSSWLLPAYFQELALRARAPRQDAFYRTLQGLTSSELRWQHARNTTSLHVQLSWHCSYVEELQFFCPMGQRMVTDIPWLYFHSHEYSVPGFYFLPEFRPRLNELFPDHAVFAHVSRYLLHPQDLVWKSITQHYDQHFRDADRRLGIQVRAWGGQYIPIVNKHILQCGIDMGLLPYPTPTSTTIDTSRGVGTNITSTSLAVLLTSLRSEYHENLANVYKNQTQSRVSVFTPGSDGRQRSGNIDHDERAVTDMWLLSFMDDLITTPSSTFGMLPAGKAGIIPVIFNKFGEDKEKLPEPTCARSNLAGPCFMDYPKFVPCWLDPPDVKIGDPDLTMPEIKMCHYNAGLGVYAET